MFNAFAAPIFALLIISADNFWDTAALDTIPPIIAIFTFSALFRLTGSIFTAKSFGAFGAGAAVRQGLAGIAVAKIIIGAVSITAAGDAFNTLAG